MAFPKGRPRPPGAGRKKGTPNKVDAAKRAEIERYVGAQQKQGPLPLDIMMKAMRYFHGLAEKATDGTPDKERLVTLSASIAKDAAPYVHPRLAQTTLRGDDESPQQHRVTVEFA
jgi:hypothetical protein